MKKRNPPIPGVYNALVIMLSLGFVFQTGNTIAQTTLCDSIFFADGKSVLSSLMQEKLDRLLKQASPLAQYEIYLMAFRYKGEEDKYRSSLVDARMNEVCRFLISRNQGGKIAELQIVDIKSVRLSPDSLTTCARRINICIQEKFPEPAFDEKVAETGKEFVENDTIIIGPKGTRVKIQEGSFEPYKLSDYRFEIKEIRTANEIADNNMNTVTNHNQVINSFIILCFGIVPKDPLTPVPFKLQKPLIFLVPLTTDSVKLNSLTVFRNSDGKRIFTGWRESNEKLNYQFYYNENYLMLSTNRPGNLMIGKETTSCKCCLIKLHRFYTQKVKIIYPEQNAVVVFDKKNCRWLSVPCAEGTGTFRIEGFAETKSRKLYSLSLNPEKSDTTKKTRKKGFTKYRIQRKDYKKA